MTFRYLSALVYDLLIISALLMLVTAACVGLNHGHAIAPATRWYQVSLIMVVFTYQILSIRACGQTIGMRAWRLKIINGNQRVRVIQVIGRMLLMGPAYCCGLLLLRDPQRLLARWTKAECIRL